jgi:hypothetical protein
VSIELAEDDDVESEQSDDCDNSWDCEEGDVDLQVHLKELSSFFSKIAQEFSVSKQYEPPLTHIHPPLFLFSPKTQKFAKSFLL